MDELEDVEKVYRGSYEYFEQNRLYSEENFEVYKNHHDNSYQFSSHVLSRVANGEFLKIHVIYKVNKDYIPILVSIDKKLGSQFVQELYIADQKQNKIQYSFHTQDESYTTLIGVSPKFYIATPATCTSFLFFLTKKFDSTNKNYYSIMTCNNMWEHEGDPIVERVMIEAPQATPISIKNGEDTLQCHLYQMYHDKDEKKINPMTFYISRHMAIPYRMTSPQKIKVEVKYLNHLEKGRVTLM